MGRASVSFLMGSNREAPYYREDLLLLVVGGWGWLGGGQVHVFTVNQWGSGVR